MRLLRINEVEQLTGLSKSSIYKQVRLGKFPAPIKITDRSSAWSSDYVDRWIVSKVKSLAAQIDEWE